MQRSTTITNTGIGTAVLTDRWPSLLVTVLGIVLLYVVGFSTVTQAHNAAHDVRHANGYPCH
jgi:cobalt transporter subunit CbtB